MRYHRLDLNLLTALRALLTEKSVTRAGEVVHLSQSAMSGVLARLREFFEDPLIVQVGRRMELTPLGETLSAQVGDVLLRIDATLASRPRFDPATSQRRFSIIASDYVTSVLLLDVLAALERDAPGLRVELRQASEDTIAELESGEVDFVVTPMQYRIQSQPFESCFADTYCAVVDAAQHKFGEALTLQEYQAARHVQFLNVGRPVFENWFAETHGELPKVDVLANSFYLMPQLLMGTSRVATVHLRHARQFARMLPVRLLRLDFAFPDLTEVLQWHRYRDNDPGNQWLRERILAAGRALPAISPGDAAHPH